MEQKKWSPRWTQVPVFVLMCVELCLCVSVRILNQRPHYVLQGDTLILQAKIDITTKGAVLTAVWEHIGPDAKRVTVARYPGPSLSDRVSIEEQGAVLKITKFRHDDSGVYIINVTDHTRQEASAQHHVEEYLAVHHVSVMVNASHTSLHCKEAWGTEPEFSWLHEQAKLDTTFGRLSEDNSTLYITAPLCGDYTCIVRNKLGHCSATYSSEPCEGKGGGGAVAVIVLFLLLACAGVLLFLLWRRRQQHRNRGERLREYDGPI